MLRAFVNYQSGGFLALVGPPLLQPLVAFGSGLGRRHRVKLTALILIGDRGHRETTKFGAISDEENAAIKQPGGA